MSAPGAGFTAQLGVLADSSLGRHPRRWALIVVALVVVLLILIVMTVVYYNKWKDLENGAKGGMLGTNPLGNLNTGSNNPLWQYQMGDAGWGGSMHSTYQDGQPRVWGASAEGPHDPVVVPHAAHGCGGVSCSLSGAPCASSPLAGAEMAGLAAAQALEPGVAGSAKNMSDDALVQVMNGNF